VVGGRFKVLFSNLFKFLCYTRDAVKRVELSRLWALPWVWLI
jgi:hypothetical protein